MHSSVKSLTQEELKQFVAANTNGRESITTEELNIGGDHRSSAQIGKILRSLCFVPKITRIGKVFKKEWIYDIDASIKNDLKTIREIEEGIVRKKAKKAENWMKNRPYFNSVVEYAATHKEISVDDILEHLELLSEAGAKPTVKKILDALGIPQVEVRKKIYRQK